MLTGALGGAYLLFSFLEYRVFRDYSMQRVHDIVDEVAQGILAESERRGGVPPENIQKIKKQQDSPVVNYRGLPFSLKARSGNAFSWYEISAKPSWAKFQDGDLVEIEKPRGVDENLLQSRERVDPEDLPPEIKAKIEEDWKKDEERFKAMGWKAADPSRNTLLDLMVQAWDREISLVVSSEDGGRVTREFREAVRVAGGERLPGLIVIMVSSGVDEDEMRTLGKQLGVKIYVADWRGRFLGRF
jgi:hypothetical protein